jgi:DNA-binding transcriptional ArsR family regulator
MLRKSKRTVERYLSELREGGYVYTISDNRNRDYEIHPLRPVQDAVDLIARHPIAKGRVRRRSHRLLR